MGGSLVRMSMWLPYARRDVKGLFKGLRPPARRGHPPAAVIRQATGAGPASPSHRRHPRSQRTTRRVAHRSRKRRIVNAIAVFPIQGAIGHIVPLLPAMPAICRPDSKPARSPWGSQRSAPGLAPGPANLRNRHAYQGPASINEPGPNP